MRTALVTLSVFGMCFLSGCGPAQYCARAVVYVESASATPDTGIDFSSEISDIESLAEPLMPRGAVLTVDRSKKDDLIRIAVTYTDPAQAADVCNRIAEAYVAKAKEAVKKTLLESATEPSRPI